ncbi:DUF6638 family protein [Leisingera caerulea]|uniref:DUF6638 family protein n=1 Tax=Leisingera caerulea TaxID=506591 RepID=UPI0003F86A1F|nr:DUF6638 family protein [Leisingera caerulea]
MIRLIERGLMFGNLVRVESPVQVARYNRALKQLTGLQTALTDFHIDISGYSPEIGDELNDRRYLNHNGCNRQFILLTVEQKSAPLLNAHFSTNREILKRFIEANEAALASLTARDAFAGEMENSVFSIDTTEHLLNHRQVVVCGDTTSNHIAAADQLKGKIARFETERDAWRDDVLIAEIVELARQTGDITRHPLSLKECEFETPDYWTSHLGGAYVFASLAEPVIIACDPARLNCDRSAEVIPLEHRNRLASFLEQNGLVENLFAAPREKAIRILRQKMDFILIGMAAETGQFTGGVSRREINALPRILGDALPCSYRALQDVMHWAEHGGSWPFIESTHPAYFYMLRAAPGPNRDLVNMLLSELCPRDVQKMYIFHKEMFYGAYRGWTDAKKEFVSDFLARSYAMNKSGVREELFGPGNQEAISSEAAQ